MGALPAIATQNKPAHRFSAPPTGLPSFFFPGSIKIPAHTADIYKQ